MEVKKGDGEREQGRGLEREKGDTRGSGGNGRDGMGRRERNGRKEMVFIGPLCGERDSVCYVLATQV